MEISFGCVLWWRVESLRLKSDFQFCWDALWIPRLRFGWQFGVVWGLVVVEIYFGLKRLVCGSRHGLLFFCFYCLDRVFAAEFVYFHG